MSDEAVAEHADDQRADQRADDRAAAAEQARAAEHDRRDASRLSVVCPAFGSPTLGARDQQQRREP